MSAKQQANNHQVELTFKRFYERFKTEHSTLQQHLQFAEPFMTPAEQEQLTTLLLNRLMVLYFMQQQRLLDNNPDYLTHHLHQSQQYDEPTLFYRQVLSPLFTPSPSLSLLPSTSSAPTRKTAVQGRQTVSTTLIQDSMLPILMLSKKLFTQHAIEARYPQLAIPNSAFSRLFAFFDCYTWYIEKPPGRIDGVLTPDILGYIFEQSANQQQMGAYYTREDVTDYIVSNTILPFYLEMLNRQCPELFMPNSACWQMLQDQPERYIQASVRTQEYLPGETMYDYAQRQQRYQELYATLRAGSIHSIDDLITENLNLCHLTCDLLTGLTEQTTLQCCYEQLTHLTILDPTCGTGAFLLAALNVLLPLYETCLARQYYLSCNAQACAEPEEGGAPTTTQSTTARLINQRYHSLKTILMNNLYGVDIMQEAIEICQLRLLLKLLPQVQEISALETLPELEQTIRTGNALLPLLFTPTSTATKATTTEVIANEELFDWHMAFPKVFAQGGFSVIIGNPPYVEHTRQSWLYSLQHFTTYRCANLYTCVVERSRQLLAPYGRSGMILPLAAFATKNMHTFLTAFRHWFPVSWISFYHFRPSMLFSGGKAASIPTAVFLGKVEGREQRFSTHLLKWSSEQRPHLFKLLSYSKITVPLDPANTHYYPKFGDPRENSILTKVLAHEVVNTYLTRRPDQKVRDNTMYYRSAGGLYWKIFINFPWPYHSTSNKQCSFITGYDRDVFVALFNSSLFWWYYTVTFDSFNLKDYMLFGFHFSYPDDPKCIQQLRTYSQQLMEDFQRYSKHLKRGNTGSYTIYARKSKTIIDAIDRTLAQHYGLDEDELEFILKYDLKYRLGLLPDTNEKE